MKFATFIFSGVAAAASVATLGVVLFGAKKMQAEIEEVKNKTAKVSSGVKKAFQELDF